MAAMHPENIKAEIRKKYKSLSAFERQLGLPRGSARDVLRGKSVSPTAKAMAKELGVAFKVISPGQKWIKGPSRKNMSANAECHRLNAEAK